MANEIVRILRLPFEALTTLYRDASEVRLYRNTITGHFEVGKLVDTFGLEGSMLVREATWLSEIRHENIIRVKAVAEARDKNYPPPHRVIEMVMPYYERGSIADAMARGEHFTLRQARDHVLAVLQGLAELHEVRSVLHRDIKSSNILLTGESNLVCISDLGISVPMDPDGTAQAFPSAQAYSPPEAFSLNRVDRRSDLYSCGLVLFEMANGPLPLSEYLDRLAMVERLSSGKNAVLPRHLRFNAYVPPGMRRLIRSAIAPDPRARPQSAADMANSLARVPLVDWRQIEGSDQRKIWEGRSTTQPDREFRVEAFATKTGWILRGTHKVNSWRRTIPDHTTATLSSQETQAFFDQMVKIATKR